VTHKSPLAASDRQVIDKILNYLMAEAEQPLPSSLEFYRLILTAQKKFILPDLSKLVAKIEPAAIQQIRQGKPLVTFKDLELDWQGLHSLFCEITTLTEEYIKPAKEDSEELHSFDTDLKLLQDTAKIWFAAGSRHRKNTARSPEINPLVSSILQATMLPVLSAHANALLSLVPQEQWYKKYCPVCGGEPDFAFLDKERGSRWLVCSRCNAHWLFVRLACPYCDNQDMKTLAYFTDDTSLYRLYVCEKCRRYIKAIDMRKKEAEILLPLERILTLDLDRQAYESNYRAI
jgi:FdhE protein